MTIKVVEYTHEYDDTNSERVDGVWESFPSRSRELYYAVGERGMWLARKKSGEWETENGERYTYKINGTDLHVCGREELLGYIGLFNKLLDEFPEEK